MLSPSPWIPIAGFFEKSPQISKILFEFYHAPNLASSSATRPTAQALEYTLEIMQDL